MKQHENFEEKNWHTIEYIWSYRWLHSFLVYEVLSLRKFDWKWIRLSTTCLCCVGLCFSLVFALSTVTRMSYKLKPGWITEESDLDFVLVVGGIFLSISMLFYFCDSKFRNSFYFDANEGLEDTCWNNVIIWQSIS